MCGALATRPAIAVEYRAGEVEPLLDVHRARGLAQHHAHLLGHVHEEPVEHFEPQRVGAEIRAGSRSGARRTPLEEQPALRHDRRVPVHGDPGGRSLLDQQRGPGSDWPSRRSSRRCSGTRRHAPAAQTSTVELEPAGVSALPVAAPGPRARSRRTASSRHPARMLPRIPPRSRSRAAAFGEPVQAFVRAREGGAHGRRSVPLDLDAGVQSHRTCRWAVRRTSIGVLRHALSPQFRSRRVLERCEHSAHSRDACRPNSGSPTLRRRTQRLSASPMP